MKKYTLKEKKEIAKSWDMKVSEIDWGFVGKIKPKKKKLKSPLKETEPKRAMK